MGAYVFAQVANQIATNPGAVLDTMSGIEKLTLQSALLVAIIVLWRTLAKKDDLLLTALNKMTDTLAQVGNSHTELRRIIEASESTQRELVAAINEKLVSAINELRTRIGLLHCAEEGKRQHGD